MEESTQVIQVDLRQKYFLGIDHYGSVYLAPVDKRLEWDNWLDDEEFFHSETQPLPDGCKKINFADLEFFIE